MELVHKDLLLKEIPLFADLSEEEVQFIQQRIEFRDYKKGQIIYTEGSNPDAFYCVLTGRVVIYTSDSAGTRTVLEYLHRGKYFGIISLLTGDPHSVTASAVNDSLLLFINRSAFDELLQKVPRLAIDLSKTLSRRLKRKDIHQKTIFESTIIAVFSSYSQAGKTIYALNLALSMRKETRKSVIILDITTEEHSHSLPRRLGIEEAPPVFNLSGEHADIPERIQGFIRRHESGIEVICMHYHPDDATCMGSLVNIFGRLVNDYHYLILDLPSVMDPCVFQMLNQADLIHLLTSPEPVDLTRTHHLIERLKSECSFNIEKIKVVINEYKLAKLNYDEQVALLDQRVFATLPKIELASTDRLIIDQPASEYAKAVRRISRQVSDAQVGLVLGVGVAYGFCHIGVLRVIEDEHIPIDVLASASIGAVIASLWACGYSSAEILAITKEFKEPKFIWNLIDLTVPVLGFIKGNKLHKFLKRYLGTKTFHDTRLPLKIIASDVRKKEPRVLEKGLLIDALMASCAMPGVFLPFRLKEEMLFDGGVINPLPTEPLFTMGVRKIIAVNVTPSRQDIIRQYEQLRDKITVGLPLDTPRRNWFSFRRYLRDMFKVNILDIIFSSIEILQSEVAQKEAQLADVVLHPDTSGLFWLELHKAEEFARRGEEETRRNLDKIWQMVKE